MSAAKKRAKPRLVLEEFCMDPDCKRRGTHWHAFSRASFFRDGVGEYTVTLRVRAKGRRS